MGSSALDCDLPRTGQRQRPLPPGLRASDEEARVGLHPFGPAGARRTQIASKYSTVAAEYPGADMSVPRTPILGQPALARAFDDAGARLVRYRPGQEMRRHAHDWLGVTLVLSGRLQDTIADRVIVCRPLTLVVKPAGAEHETRVASDGALTLHFTLSTAAADVLSRAGLDLDRCHHLHAGRAAAPLLELLHGSPHADTPVGAVLADAILKSAGNTPLAEPPPDFAHESTRAAASAVGMHPVAFARRFRRRTGVSPTDWRLRRRVEFAAAALAGGSDALASIACDAGFADQAHLCRVFKRQTGLTPGVFRRIVHEMQRPC